MGGKNIIIIAVVGIVALAGGFFGGMQYQKSKGGTLPGGFRQMGSGTPPQVGGSMTPGSNGRGGGVAGEVISMDDQSITVKTSDGSTKVVYLSDSTAVFKSSKTDKNDLVNGNQVLVTGSSNTDGSIAATNIQIQSK